MQVKGVKAPEPPVPQKKSETEKKAEKVEEEKKQDDTKMNKTIKDIPYDPRP